MIDVRRNPNGPSRLRGFTLVELLVTITIIGILATMLLGASSLAMGTAREARTESLVTRLHTLVSQHYDSFRHRRVEVVENSLSGRDLAAVRLWATREQLRMELPDRWSDITLGQVTSLTKLTNLPAPTYLAERPAMSRMFARRYNQAVQVCQDKSLGVDKLLENQGAECLYLIVMLACGDGESAGLFRESDIGDVDGDGAPEFLDSWGNPIEFLRWAPGFDSDLQLSVPRLDRLTTDPLRVQAVLADHDPFDLFRVDKYDPTIATASNRVRAFRLLPLIYSAGPDQLYGLQDGYSDANNVPFAGENAETRTGDFTADRSLMFEQVSDPYLSVSGSFLGEGSRDASRRPTTAATDNIHNHLITGR